jgi:phage protein U
MYAQLGDVTFDLPTYWDAHGVRRAYEYAEHKVIEGKPRLQWVGDALDEISIKIVLHASYCNPELELNNLRNAATAHQALPYVTGAGVYKGNYVITALEEDTRHTDPQGRVIYLEAMLSLKEYVGVTSTPSGEAVVTIGQTIPGAVNNVQAAVTVAAGLTDAVANTAEAVCTCMEILHVDWPSALNSLVKIAELGAWSAAQTVAQLATVTVVANTVGITGLSGLAQVGAAAILAVDCASDPVTGIACLTAFLDGLSGSNLLGAFATKLASVPTDPLQALAASQGGDLVYAAGTQLRMTASANPALVPAWLPPDAVDFGVVLMSRLPLYEQLLGQITAFADQDAGVPISLFAEPLSFDWVHTLVRFPA